MNADTVQMDEAPANTDVSPQVAEFVPETQEI